MSEPGIKIDTNGKNGLVYMGEIELYGRSVSLSIIT